MQGKYLYLSKMMLSKYVKQEFAELIIKYDLKNGEIKHFIDWNTQ